MVSHADQADGLLTKAQRDKISISELARYIFGHAQSGDISLFDLESLLFRFCPTIRKNVTIDDPADKEFRLKFFEAVSVLKRRGLLMDVIQVGMPWRLETHLTSVGQRSEYRDEVLLLVDDPQDIVSDLKGKIPNLDPVVEQYYLESLRACQEDLYISSVICLGAASERAITCLADAIVAHDGQYKQDIEKCGSIAPLTRHLLGVINGVFTPIAGRAFASRLKDKLEGVARIYRINRNEAGHPTGILPDWSREEQQGNLSQFRAYAATIFEAIDHLSST